MKGKTILACIVTLLILLSMPKVMAQPPMPPCMFYGYVYVGEKLAQDGLNVTAVISGTKLKWTTETRSGTYGWPAKGSSSFEIPSNDPETPEKDGGVTGDRIEFYVNGTNTNQTATFVSGGGREMETDLSISGSTPEQPESPNPYPLYAILIVIVIGIGSLVAFWIYRKGYKIKVLKKSRHRL
jgi:hypothetical protein